MADKVIKKLVRYTKIWLLMSKSSFMTIAIDRFGFFVFLFGKVVRFIMYFGFLYFLLKGTNTLEGYTLNQTLFLFLTFNLIDIIGQFLFRGVYRFRPLVVSGGFDLILSKPINPLFRSLVSDADFIDLVTIPPLIAATYYFGMSLDPSFYEVILYILLLVNGLIISAAFHIFVLGLGILTLEIDHTTAIYRDIMAMGRFPIDIYKEPLRGILTFIVPVGVMITLPVQALAGTASWQMIILAFAISTVMIFGSYKFWNFALKKYSSASS